MAGGQAILGASEQVPDINEQVLGTNEQFFGAGHSFLLSDFQKAMVPPRFHSFSTAEVPKSYGAGNCMAGGQSTLGISKHVPSASEQVRGAAHSFSSVKIPKSRGFQISHCIVLLI